MRLLTKRIELELTWTALLAEEEETYDQRREHILGRLVDETIRALNSWEDEGGRVQ